MKTASLFVLLCLLSGNLAFDTQAQKRLVRTGSGPGSPAAQPRRGGGSGRVTASAVTQPQGRTSNSHRQQSAPGNPKSHLLNSLPIRRVILYSNGVAYIERRGLVSNHAEISLSFKQSQVDDVLKSMVVLDLGKGRIGAVSYNSSAPPSSRMAEIPFAISASTDGNNGGGLAGVLSQLQGARVIVTTANRTVTGSVLTVEGRRSQIDSNKPAVTTQRLVIGSENGELTSFDLAEVRSVQLADEGSRRDLSEFAHAAASARRRDAKTIVVTSDGKGEREMIVSYTIAAPIWKTTYRVLLDTSGKPFFQGWAIVDNVSEEDWNGIELSLVSGTPVSFIQPIQNPVYRYRPVVPLPDDLNLKPQTYEPGEEGGGTGSVSGRITDPAGAGVPGVGITVTNTASQQSFEVTADDEGFYRADNLPPGSYTLRASATNFKPMVATDLNIRPGMRSKFSGSLDAGNISETVTITASSAEIVSIEKSMLTENPRRVTDLALMSPGAAGGGGGGRNRESISNLVSRRESGVDAETTASDIGDLFEYHIDQPVTVPRDRSALIPILQTRMEGERVSIYRGSSSADGDEDSAHTSRPMGGMLLKNTSALTLEDGSLTVIDGDAYAGEALLERLKPGEERLISFALDLGTLVSVRDDDEDRQPTFLVRAVNGVVEAHYYDLRRKVYTLVNQTDRPRVVYIEHPRDKDEDWQLVAGTAALLQPASTRIAADNTSVANTDDNATASSRAADYSGAVTKTANHYRFRVTLAPHQKLELPVVERNERRDSYQLTSFTRGDLELFIARRYIDDNTRAALEAIIALKDRVADAEARLQEINREAAEIALDQQRLRENIKALTSTAEAKQLITRYVAKANEQETRLEQIEKDRRAVTEERSRLQAELAAAVRSLSLDRRLN